MCERATVCGSDIISIERLRQAKLVQPFWVAFRESAGLYSGFILFIGFARASALFQTPSRLSSLLPSPLPLFTFQIFFFLYWFSVFSLLTTLCPFIFPLLHSSLLFSVLCSLVSSFVSLSPASFLPYSVLPFLPYLCCQCTSWYNFLTFHPPLISSFISSFYSVVLSLLPNFLPFFIPLLPNNLF